jgi:hypothetical protein
VRARAWLRKQRFADRHLKAARRLVTLLRRLDNGIYEQRIDVARPAYAFVSDKLSSR